MDVTKGITVNTGYKKKETTKRLIENSPKENA
jgi:hypothetical protein